MEFWEMFSTTLGSAAVIAAIIVLFFSINRKNQFYKTHQKANIIIAILVFGALSAYASASAISIDGVLCNCRDLSPLFAGLVLGPWAGIGAGVIGGTFRFFVYGGPAAVPCMLACLIAGVIGSVLHIAVKNKKVRYNLFFTMAVSAAVEGIHLSLGLAFGLVDAVTIMGPPMILSNIFGMAFSIYMTKIFFMTKEN